MTSRGRVVIVGIRSGRIDADDLVEPAEADVERGVRDQLDHLGLRELGAHLGPERVVDLPVIDGQLLGEAQGGPLARADQG
jgi:hypothetical protein